MDFYKVQKKKKQSGKKKPSKADSQSPSQSHSTAHDSHKGSHANSRSADSQSSDSQHTDSQKKAGKDSIHNDHHFKLDKEYLMTAGRRALGNFLMLFAVYAIGWVFFQPAIEEIRYAYRNIVGAQYVIAEDAPSAAETEEDAPTFRMQENAGEKGLLSRVLGAQRVEPIVPVDPQFSIVIPKLGANSNVVPNVNTANEDDYLNALQQGVAHAAGTAFPGQNEHIYLFAHSTNTFSNVSRYNAIFYLLYKLEDGDEINVYHNGIRHKYNVTSKIIVDPSDVQYLTRKTDREVLTLQTCWPPGTVAQRLLVFAE